jgi:hypothetical protein
VELSEEEFEAGLVRLLLDEPLTLHPAQHGWLVHTSTKATGKPQWQQLAHQSLGGLCKPGQPRGTCLSLLDDVMGLGEWEKLAVGLGLSFEPMRESIAQSLDETMTPQFFAAAIGAGLVTWALLAANPEPVFTKAAAIISAVMLIYLGVDVFLALVKACQELKRATDRATTWEELEEASQRFGRAVGPRVARVFILAVTVVVGRGTVGGIRWGMERLSRLPRFAEVAAVGGPQVGIVLEQVGEVSRVAVVQEGLAISLTPSAVAVFSTGSGNPGGSASTQGTGTNMTTTRQSGGVTYRFNTGHAFNRAHRTGSDLRNTNLTPDDVENAIMDHVNALRTSGGTLPMASGGAVPQPYLGRVRVGAHTIGFSAIQTPGGSVSVGTYYLLP